MNHDEDNGRVRITGGSTAPRDQGTIPPELLRGVYSKLSPQSVKIIENLARARGSTPQEVLAEALKGYLASELPRIDVEGIIRGLKPTLRQVGFAVGRIRGLVRRWRDE